MPIATGYSTRTLPQAVCDLKNQCKNCKPRVVICFGSSRYDPAELSAQMEAAFPGACVIGCSTAGEIAGGKMMTDSVVAMFLDGTIVEEACAAVVENLRDEVSVSDAFSQFEQHFHAPISSLDVGRHVGLVLIDGLSGAEERLMEKIGDRTDLFFVGGSAGDDLKFKSTHVMANGKAYGNAAVLVLLRLKNGFDIVKTQSFKTTGKRLLATKVDEARRIVIEFDGKPAVEAYAQALNIAPKDVATKFMSHPLGLMIAGEPFVRSPQRVEGTSLVFYCNIKQDAELHVLAGTDIVGDTRATIEAKVASLGRIAGLIDFQCILRALELRDEKRCDQYGAIFKDIPAIGFSTYGEEYLGHINQTSTVLVFR